VTQEKTMGVWVEGGYRWFVYTGSSSQEYDNAQGCCSCKYGFSGELRTPAFSHTVIYIQFDFTKRAKPNNISKLFYANNRL
jgi:hypothetical protein